MLRVFDRSAEEEKVKQSLTKTRQGFFGRIAGLLAGDVTDELWDELEALLIQADVGASTTLKLVEEVREEARRRGIRKADDVRELLKEHMVRVLEEHRRPHAPDERLLTVILVVGVNGSGKTTSIGKLARWHQKRGRTVMLAAGDTFRAAAIDQLKIWGDRVGAEVIAGGPGGDPGAVVYDAIRAALARHVDVLIVDTAGRLHTKYNLMQELKKVRSVAAKQVHKAPHETLLVLDATTGQNGLAQARVFKDAVEVSGVILAKLDGTAKGGIVFAIANELGIPIQFVGTGEKADDLAEFDARAFVEGLFA